MGLYHIQKTVSNTKLFKNYKGIIVWDFDGVLFDVKRYRLDNRSALIKLGVPEKTLVRIVDKMREGGKHFSAREFIRRLRKTKYRLPDKLIRRIFFQDHLPTGKYYPASVDRLLHRLRKMGFIEIILSLGSTSHQYKKIFTGCGASFLKHFERMYVTTRPKFLTLLKIQKKYPGLPLIFIDDTRQHLLLAKKHVPGINTIFYPNFSRRSLKSLEKKILHRAGIK